MYCEQFLPFNFRTYPQQDTFYKTERGGGSGSSEMLKQACLSEVYGRKPEDSHVELTFPRRKIHISGSTILNPTTLLTLLLQLSRIRPAFRLSL